jgi:vacuolar protein-sorting-associated protein 4
MLDGFVLILYSVFRYSGSDMNTLIRDASFEPLRKCERATCFKTIKDVDG